MCALANVKAMNKEDFIEHCLQQGWQFRFNVDREWLGLIHDPSIGKIRTGNDYRTYVCNVPIPYTYQKYLKPTVLPPLDVPDEWESSESSDEHDTW